MNSAATTPDLERDSGRLECAWQPGRAIVVRFEPVDVDRGTALYAGLQGQTVRVYVLGPASAAAGATLKELGPPTAGSGGRCLPTSAVSTLSSSSLVMWTTCKCRPGPGPARVQRRLVLLLRRVKQCRNLLLQDLYPTRILSRQWFSGGPQNGRTHSGQLQARMLAWARSMKNGMLREQCVTQSVEAALLMAKTA